MPPSRSRASRGQSHRTRAWAPGGVRVWKWCRARRLADPRAPRPGPLARVTQTAGRPGGAGEGPGVGGEPPGNRWPAAPERTPRSGWTAAQRPQSPPGRRRHLHALGSPAGQNRNFLGSSGRVHERERVAGSHDARSCRGRGRTTTPGMQGGAWAYNSQGSPREGERGLRFPACSARTPLPSPASGRPAVEEEGSDLESGVGLASGTVCGYRALEVKYTRSSESRKNVNYLTGIFIFLHVGNSFYVLG